MYPQHTPRRGRIVTFSFRWGMSTSEEARILFSLSRKQQFPPLQVANVKHYGQSHEEEPGVTPAEPSPPTHVHLLQPTQAFPAVIHDPDDCSHLLMLRCLSSRHNIFLAWKVWGRGQLKVKTSFYFILYLPPPISILSFYLSRAL